MTSFQHNENYLLPAAGVQPCPADFHGNGRREAGDILRATRSA